MKPWIAIDNFNSQTMCKHFKSSCRPEDQAVFQHCHTCRLLVRRPRMTPLFEVMSSRLARVAYLMLCDPIRSEPIRSVRFEGAALHDERQQHATNGNDVSCISISISISICIDHSIFIYAHFCNNLIFKQFQYFPLSCRLLFIIYYLFLFSSLLIFMAISTNCIQSALFGVYCFTVSYVYPKPKQGHHRGLLTSGVWRLMINAAGGRGIILPIVIKWNASSMTNYICIYL